MPCARVTMLSVVVLSGIEPGALLFARPVEGLAPRSCDLRNFGSCRLMLALARREVTCSFCGLVHQFGRPVRRLDGEVQLAELLRQPVGAPCSRWTPSWTRRVVMTGSWR